MTLHCAVNSKILGCLPRKGDGYVWLALRVSCTVTRGAPDVFGGSLRWFKHMVGMRRDEKITNLLDSHGHRGLCFYIWVLEIIAEQMDNSDRCSVSHSKQQWAKMLGTYWKDAEKILGRCRDLGLIFLTSSGEDLDISCPKLLKIRARKKPIGNETRIPDIDIDIEKEPPNPQGEAFEIFWKAYPKKVAKQDALRAWKKAKVNGGLQKILDAIEGQKKGRKWKEEGGRFIPNPATWINGGCWEDDIQPYVRDEIVAEDAF